MHLDIDALSQKIFALESIVTLQDNFMKIQADQLQMARQENKDLKDMMLLLISENKDLKAIMNKFEDRITERLQAPTSTDNPTGRTPPFLGDFTSIDTKMTENTGPTAPSFAQVAKRPTTNKNPNGTARAPISIQHRYDRPEPLDEEAFKILTKRKSPRYFTSRPRATRKDSAEFIMVHIEGLPRQPITNIRKIFEYAEIDNAAIPSITYLGDLCEILVEIIYLPTFKTKLAARVGTATILQDVSLTSATSLKATKFNDLSVVEKAKTARKITRNKLSRIIEKSNNPITKDYYKHLLAHIPNDEEPKDDANKDNSLDHEMDTTESQTSPTEEQNPQCLAAEGTSA